MQPVTCAAGAQAGTPTKVWVVESALGVGGTSPWGGVGLEGLRPRLTVTAGAGGETLDWGAAG
mgnify:CR=1 FL=1